MKKAILIIAQVFITALLSAQTTPDFKSIISPGENITASAETENSFWVGTDKGLYRIKKKNRKVYKYTVNNSAIPSNHIKCICAQPDGQVFIGTDRGIIRYDLYAFILINKENSQLTSDDIKAITYHPIKGILVTTDNDAVATIK